MTAIDAFAKTLDLRPCFSSTEIMGKTAMLRVELAFNAVTCKYEVSTEGYPPGSFKWDQEFATTEIKAARAHDLRALQLTLALAEEGSL